MRASSFACLQFACLLALTLSGCSAGINGSMTSTGTPTPQAGKALSGNVHGGQQPIVGASVYLYAANTTGYGSASVSLLNSSGSNTHMDGSGNYYVTTGADGGFTITGDYTCPSATSQVYLYSVGGNPGSGVNSAAGLMVALGTCAVPVTTSFIYMDEVSTVATAYAIAGYATDATHVSSSGSNLALTGIANAFEAVQNLETLNTGVALAATPAGNGTVPQTEIDTLANILAACINTASSSSANCTTLLGNAKNGSTTPTDTATAAINIAHNPGANIGALYPLQPSTGAPFQPALTGAPNDFTIAINYTDVWLDYPWGIAVDATGDVWVVDNDTNGPVRKFNPLGAVLSGTNGFTGGGLFVPVNIAIDGSGNVWVPDDPSSKLSEFNSSGTPNSSSPYSGGGMDTPYFIAVDGSNHVWLSNSSASQLSEFGSAGPITGSGGYPATNLSGRNIIADTAGNIWITSTTPGNGGIFEFNSSGQVSANSPITTGGGLQAPQGIAIDASGNVWVTNDNSTLSEFSPSGSSISGTGGFSGGGLNGPTDLAIDGAGNVWVVSTLGPLSEFSSSGGAVSGSNGYKAASLDHCVALAVDGSGNVWITNFDGGNGMTEFVGVATPVVTPIAANLMSPYGAHAVNKP